MGNHLSDLSRNSLQENTCCARAVERSRVAHQVFDIGQSLALHFVSAHAIHRLRRQPDMRGNRNFRVNDLANQVGTFLSAFHLHHLRPAFLHKTRGVADGLFRVHME